MITRTNKGKAPCIAIVAPSGYAPEDRALDVATARLREQGCAVRNFCQPDEKFERFAATDAARAAQLHAAATDPEVDIVMALRGGYGLSRLLPLLDLPLLAASGKLFVGHSDFTALHLALLSQGGAMSFAGPMMYDDFTCAEPSALTLPDFWQCLAGPSHSVRGALDANPAVELEGPLWGGNLAIMAHLTGTPYMPVIEGGILFLEDINEHPFRVERMLLQLLYSGMLARQKALVLGDFSGYQLSAYDNGYDFNATLAFLRSKSGIPVLTGLAFGHIRDKVTLAIGSHARLVSDGRGFELTMSDYPNL